MSEKFQAVVIGGGPSGYVCAIRLAQLGLKTACIESRGSLGGTCLNVGCIPSKSLLNLSDEFHKVQNLSSKGIEVGNVKLNLEKMMKSKDKAVTILTKGVEFLLKKNKVTYYKGHGSFKSQNEILIKDVQNKEIIIQTEKTVIATGSVPVSLPGIEIDEKVIVSSTSKQFIIDSVNQWANAWSEQDVDKYLAAYANEFIPTKGLTKKRWEKIRIERLLAPGFIKITLSNLKISMRGENYAKVNFMQTYQSDSYKDRIKKELLLEKINGEWLIIKEK